MKELTSTIFTKYSRPFLSKKNKTVIFYISKEDALRLEKPWIGKYVEDTFTEDEKKMVVGVRFSSYLVDSHLKLKENYRFLEQLTEIKHLKFLSIPADYLHKVDINVLKKIEYLAITDPLDRKLFSEILKNKSFTLPDICFEKVTNLEFYFPFSYFSNFSKAKFPNLEWASMKLDDLDKRGVGSFKLFKDYPEFTGFYLNSVKDKDILSRIRTDIKGLYIWSISNKKFNFQALDKLTELKYLWLHGHSGIFDFSVISTLEQLEEIEISGFKGVTNIDKLFGLKNLKQLILCYIDDDSYLENKELLDFLKRRKIKYDIR